MNVGLFGAHLAQLVGCWVIETRQRKYQCGDPGSGETWNWASFSSAAHALTYLAHPSCTPAFPPSQPSSQLYPEGAAPSLKFFARGQE